MFLDLFDTVRTSPKVNDLETCENSTTQAEIALFYLMIMGFRPTLTQTQIMDSNTIIKIVRSKYKDSFLRLLNKGYIRISLYPGTKSIQEHFLRAMKMGLDGSNDFFEFSSIPFMSEYDVERRKALQSKIIDACINGYYNYQCDGIKPEHSEYIGELVQAVIEINTAVKSGYLRGNRPANNLDNAIRETLINLINSEPEDLELKELTKEVLRYNFGNKRSAYYNFLFNNKTYAKEKTDKIKTIVDCCYNIIIASSVNDDEGSKLSVSTDCKNLIPYLNLDKDINIEENKVFQSGKNEYLTWENIERILNEIENIQKKKKCARQEAVMHYKARQSRAPVTIIGKYIGISALTMPLQFIPVIKDIPELIMGAVTDTVTEKLKKPSVADMVSVIKHSKHKVDIANSALEYLSVNL